MANPPFPNLGGGRGTPFSAVIALNGNLSTAVDLGSQRPVRLIMPAAWTAADLTFQASNDGTTFNNLYDSLGNEYTVKVDINRAVILPVYDFYGIRFLKLRSGTSGSPVTQLAARTILVVPGT